MMNDCSFILLYDFQKVKINFMQETFKLAEPRKDYEIYSRVTLMGII